MNQNEQFHDKAILQQLMTRACLYKGNTNYEMKL